MKLTKLLFFLFLGLTISFSSCKKDEIDTTEEIKDEIDKPKVTTSNALLARVLSSEDGLELGCVKVLYPFDVILLDSSIVSVNNVDDFNLFEENENNFVVDFIYPISVSVNDGDALEIATGFALGEAFASCIPDTGWTEEGGFPVFLFEFESFCYEFDYPVNMIDNGGVKFKAENLDEFVELVASNEMLFFDWSLNLIDEEGVSLQVNSEDELFMAFAECEYIDTPCDSVFFGDDAIFLECYQLVLPVTVVDYEGTEIVVESVDEYYFQIFTGFSGFSYPVTLLSLETGETLTINDEHELDKALEKCWNTPFVDKDIDVLVFNSNQFNSGYGCYDIVFPISLAKISGETISVDQNELENALGGSDIYGLVYPVTVVTNTEETVILDDIGDLFHVLENCKAEGGDESDNEDLVVLFENGTNIFNTQGCYEVVYPIAAYSVLDSMNTFVEFNNQGELEEALFLLNFGGTLIYPVTVTQDGQPIELSNSMNLYDIIEACDSHGNEIETFSEFVFGSTLGCYDLVFPFEFYQGGELKVATDKEDLLGHWGSPEHNDFKFPFSVTILETNEQLKLNSSHDLKELFLICN